MFELKEVFGVVAGVLSVVAFFPYVYSIIKGKTKPARATWFIWTAVTVMLFLSYKDVGGGSAIWLSLGYVIGVGVTALLSIKYGKGGWSFLDRAVLALSILVIFIWWGTGSALLALVMTMFADVLGAIPTIKHSYLNPEEESRIAWSIGLFANFINLFAIEAWDFTHAAYSAIALVSPP